MLLSNNLLNRFEQHNHLLNCYSVATLELKRVHKISRQGHCSELASYVFCYSSQIYRYITTDVMTCETVQAKKN